MKILHLNKRGPSCLVLALFFSITSIGSSVQALDETFFSGNNILYYDPEAGCSVVSTGSPAESSCGSKFNIATYNIFYSSAPGGGGWESRLRHTADVIKNKEGGIDVAGLQEVREDQWRALQTEEYLGDTYGIYPKPYGGGAYPGQNPIVWNKGRFDLVEGKALPGYTVGGQQNPTVSVQVKLKDKASGQEFYVINGHHPAGNNFDRQRTKMVKDLYAHAKGLNSPSTPVFMTADFNTKLTPRDQGAGTAREDLAYCVLTQDPFWHVYDARDNKTGPCPSREFSLDGGRVPQPVDHIFMSDTVKASKVSRVPSGINSNGSDVHDTIIASVSITGDCAGSGGSGGAKGAIKVAHGNIKNRPNLVPRLVGDNPDFVSLNESGRSSINQLKVPGYDGYRDDSAFKNGPATAQAKSTSVLWKKDKWTKVDAGRLIILPNGPQKWDSGRAITWVVLKDPRGGTASMVSLHHMINPNKYADRAVRQQLYGEAMDKVVNKMRELSALGPVVLAGDFNFQISDDNSYGPRKKLAAVNMESTYDSLGRPPKVAVDYIFYTKNNVKADSHRVLPEPQSGSDHPFIFATLTADGSGSGAIDSPTTSTGSCVCTDPNSNPGDLAPPGGSDVSKHFSLGNDKSRRPVNLLKQLMADFNFKDFQAAGIVGNFMHESGGAHVPPNVNEGGAAGPPRFSGGYGWAQWTGGRQTAFINFAVANGFMASRNVSATDAANYAYLVHELTDTAEKAAVPAVKGTSDVSEAAAKFEEVFERAGVVANESRDTHARNVLSAYKNNTGVGAPGTFSTNSEQACPESNAGTDQSAKFGEVAFPLKGSKSVVKNSAIFRNNTTDRGGHPYIAYDIYAGAGTEVLAFAGGVVTSLHDGELGKGVSVYNQKAGLVVYYTHMANVSVNEGATVSPGDKLGTLASVNTYPDINVDHLHIDASTDRVRQACSRSSCPIQDHFREIGPDLFNTYQKLPD